MRTRGVAMGVLGQQPEHDAVGGDHRLRGVAGLVTEHLRQLDFEAGRAFGVGLVLRAGEVTDEGMQDRLRQRVDDELAGRLGATRVGFGGPGQDGHWNGISWLGEPPEAAFDDIFLL